MSIEAARLRLLRALPELVPFASEARSIVGDAGTVNLAFMNEEHPAQSVLGMLIVFGEDEALRIGGAFSGVNAVFGASLYLGMGWVFENRRAGRWLSSLQPEELRAILTFLVSASEDARFLDCDRDFYFGTAIESLTEFLRWRLNASESQGS